MTILQRLLLALPIAASTLLATGCERALFAFVNRGARPPDASIAYAPDRALSLDVFRARGAGAQPAPVVVFFYGGAWKRGERAQYRFVGRRLADNGVLAIVADYRTWPRAGFPAFMDDAADAVAWTRAHAAGYGGDPGRIFLMGHSAGAQIAALLGTDAHYLRARGIEAGSLAGVIGLSGPYDFVIGEYAPIFGPPSQWPKAQAVNFVDGDEPPFLLVHGDRDRVVEFRDSPELAGLLHAAGGAARVVPIAGGGHSAPLAGLYDPRRSPAVLPARRGLIAPPGRDGRGERQGECDGT
jgi:acetyl esterase/lipase